MGNSQQASSFMSSKHHKATKRIEKGTGKVSSGVSSLSKTSRVRGISSSSSRENRGNEGAASLPKLVGRPAKFDASKQIDGEVTKAHSSSRKSCDANKSGRLTTETSLPILTDAESTLPEVGTSRNVMEINCEVKLEKEKDKERKFIGQIGSLVKLNSELASSSNNKSSSPAPLYASLATSPATSPVNRCASPDAMTLTSCLGMGGAGRLNANSIRASNLVENQGQRVRDWVNSQPFIVKKSEFHNETRCNNNEGEDEQKSTTGRVQTPEKITKQRVDEMSESCCELSTATTTLEIRSLGSPSKSFNSNSNSNKSSSSFSHEQAGEQMTTVSGMTGTRANEEPQPAMLVSGHDQLNVATQSSGLDELATDRTDCSCLAAAAAAAISSGTTTSDNTSRTLSTSIDGADALSSTSSKQLDADAVALLTNKEEIVSFVGANKGCYDKSKRGRRQRRRMERMRSVRSSGKSEQAASDSEDPLIEEGINNAESCSLCQYLESIQTAIERKSGSNSSETQPSPLTTVCHHQQAYNNKSNSRQPVVANNNKQHQHQQEQESTSVWTGVINLAEQKGKLNYEFQAHSRVVRRRQRMKSSSGNLVVGDATGQQWSEHLNEDEVEEAFDELEAYPIHESIQQPFGLSNRPSSAHSKLFPHERDTNEQSSKMPEAGGAKNTESVHPSLNEKQVVASSSSSTGRPFLQSLRGFSLDASNRQHQQQQQKTYPNSKGDLGTGKKSQSSKLIVISSNHVAYTIRVANSFGRNDKQSLKSNINCINADQNKEESAESSEGNLRTTIQEINETSGKSDEFTKEKEQVRDATDSCRKFLVKKISGSKPKEYKRTIRVKKKGEFGASSCRTEVGEIERTNTKEASGLRTSEQLDQTKMAAEIYVEPDKDNEEDGEDNLETELTAESEAGSSSQSHQSVMATLSPGSSSDISSQNYGSNYKSTLLETVRMNVPGAIDATELHFTMDETSRSCGVAAKRLRDLAAHLEHGSVPRSVLYQTLEYAASILDSVTMDQISRVSDEEEGDLSEVQSDAVPNEVRKWLETTFTRNSISQKRRSEDKLKFRSVANAIRAGIVVDRIYRRMSASSPFVSAEVSQLLRSIDHWSFDCFSVNQASNGQVLKSVGYELFNRYGLMYKFKIPTSVLKNFLTQIELGYVKHKNPYHNNLHAADVTQTVHYMLWQAGLTNWLSDLEIFATLLAAIIHDYLHTGTTNNFHVMSQSDTALIYNDRAVLENFHICQAFTLMKNEDCNILAGLSKDEYREFRSLVIDMVLATDMSSHFQQIKAMKNILNHSDNFNADKSKILSLVIHISDISHPAKEWELHSTWTQLLMEEFFRQGDREKELDLECSPLCDRETTLVAESQLGFIEFIVSPSLEVCGDVLDRVHYHLAEANARPVLPASAKAASVVAAQSSSGSGSGQSVAAIERAPSTGQLEEPADKSWQEKRETGSGGHQQQAGGVQVAKTLGSTSSAGSTSSSSSLAGSLASVAENTLTSNLRKMIVSSSATIGRRLNITSGSSQQQPPPLPSRSGLAKVAGSSSPQVAASSSSGSDFATRQANYKHPVIKCDSFSQARPKSCDPRENSHQQQHQTPSADIGRLSDDTPRSGSSAQDHRTQTHSDTQEASQSKQQSSSNNLKGPPPSQQVDSLGGSGTKRSSSSALATCGQPGRSTTCGQLLMPIKVQRPWIKCLERNKKMWQERAITDAKARELKEKLKQQQLEDSNTLTQIEPQTQ